MFNLEKRFGRFTDPDHTPYDRGGPDDINPRSDTQREDHGSDSPWGQRDPSQDTGPDDRGHGSGTSGVGAFF